MGRMGFIDQNCHKINFALDGVENALEIKQWREKTIITLVGWGQERFYSGPQWQPPPFLCTSSFSDALVPFDE